MDECERIADELPLFLLGDLDESGSGMVRAHLVSCAACRSELDRQARAVAWLAAREVPAASPPRRRRWAAAVAVAAGLAGAFALGVRAGGGSPAGGAERLVAVAERAAAVPSDLGRALVLLRAAR